MKLLPVIALFIAFSATGETTLRYCEENPQEICFTGVYRGTCFHCDDFDEWQPCEIGELSMTVGCEEFSLGRITWGSVKAGL